jgi:hypothetical protein
VMRNWGKHSRNFLAGYGKFGQGDNNPVGHSRFCCAGRKPLLPDDCFMLQVVRKGFPTTHEKNRLPLSVKIS